jgi:hypothetical protein
MKTILVLLTVAITCSRASAQLKGFSIGPYIEVAKPTGHLDETNKNGAGVGLNADIRLGKFGLTGSAGFMHFPGKTIETSDGAKESRAINVIPVRAGIKYRLVPVLYAKLEGGVANYTNNDGSAFIVSPGIGLRILGLDVQAKYETWIKSGSRSFWGLKAGYNF